MYYVYLLYSEKANEVYKGYSTDLKKRMKSHNSGNVKSTKKGIPWKLIYYEAFTSSKDARREEIFLKTGKGRDRIKYLVEDTLQNLK